MDIDKLLAEHQSLIEDLRNRTKDVLSRDPSSYDDIFLLRYVLTHHKKSGMAAAEDAIRKTIAWRTENSVVLDQVAATGKAPHEDIVRRFTTAGYSCDLHGYEPVWVVRTGHSNQKAMMSTLTIEQVGDWLHYRCRPICSSYVCTNHFALLSESGNHIIIIALISCSVLHDLFLISDLLLHLCPVPPKQQGAVLAHVRPEDQEVEEADQGDGESPAARPCPFSRSRRVRSLEGGRRWRVPSSAGPVYPNRQSSATFRLLRPARGPGESRRAPRPARADDLRHRLRGPQPLRGRLPLQPRPRQVIGDVGPLLPPGAAPRPRPPRPRPADPPPASRGGSVLPPGNLSEI